MFSTRSDVFAFGIVLWQLLHLEVPYVDVTPLEIRDSIREGSRLPISPDIHQDLAKLVTQSWDQNPRNRPTFTEIVVFLKAFLATNPLVNMELPTRLILPTIPSSKIKPGSLDGKKSHNSSGDFVKPVPTNLSYSKKKKLVIVGLVVALVVASIIGIVVAVVVNLNKSANESSSTLSTTASATTFTTTFSSSIGSATFTSSSAPVRTSIPIFPSSNVNVSTLVKKTDLENISVRKYLIFRVSL